MISLADLQFMEALARAGSLSGAARSLNVTPPALSLRLKKLEQALGVSLVVQLAPRALHRRRRAPGERGAGGPVPHRRPHRPARPGGRRPAGPLRVVAPFGFGRLHVAPLVARFAERHKSIRVTLDLSERPWTDSEDADVVVHIGAVRDLDLGRARTGAQRSLVCAAPAYLDRRGTPADPRDLLQHDCLCVRENNEDVTLWRHKRGGRTGAVRVTPTLTSNDGEVVRNWALAGLGLHAALAMGCGALREARRTPARAGAVVVRGRRHPGAGTGAPRHLGPRHLLRRLPEIVPQVPAAGALASVFA